MYTGAKEVRKTRVSQAYTGNTDQTEVTNPNSSVSIRDLPKALKIIMTNPVFLLVSLAGIVEAGAISGLSVFIPKFMQNQFGVTTSTGSILAGKIK